jgi:hypothetical protein
MRTRSQIILTGLSGPCALQNEATLQTPPARNPARSQILRLADNPRTERDFPIRTGNAARSRRENPHDARSKRGPAVSGGFMKRDERP